MMSKEVIAKSVSITFFSPLSAVRIAAVTWLPKVAKNVCVFAVDNL
jgi:hypothetical protein